MKVFANKTSHFVGSWYRPPGSTSEEFQLFREQLDYIRTHHKGKKLPSVHVLGDFNFKDIDWPDRLSKSGLTLSQSEGQILIDIMNDHGLEQMVHFPTREKNILDLILTTLPGQFQDVHSPDKLSDHDIVSGTLKIYIPPIKKPRRKVYLYQKGDYESMRKDTLEFAQEKYFNGHSDTRSVQENFSEAKKRIYPFQCLATNSIAKQFAFKEFMRGCIKCFFKFDNFFHSRLGG